MATFRRRTFLAALLMTAALSVGCNVMALPFFLIPGLEPKHEPKCKLTSDDKNKEVRVLILPSCGLETRPEFLRVDGELGRMLAQQLTESYKANKEKVTFVPASRVEKYKDDHPNWHSFDPVDIGKHFKADYLIELEIDALTLYEAGSINTLFQGRADISIAVIDIHNASEGPIYKEEIRCEYPPGGRPIPASERNAAQFRQQFLGVVARQLSWRFVSHPFDDDLKLD